MRSGIGSRILTVDALLPTAPQFEPQGRAAKSSWTVHWEGSGALDPDASDDDALALTKAIAAYHIETDWRSRQERERDPGHPVHGSGIMYAYVVAPSGRIFATRDPMAILWHSNNAVGNESSIPVCVIADPDHPPTSAQLESLRGLVTDDEGTVVGPGGGMLFELTAHREWTSTACPGDTLFDYAERIRAGVLDDQEDDDAMTPEQLKASVEKLEDLADAISIYITRAQLELRADNGKPLDSARPDPPEDPARKVLEDRARARALHA